MPRVADQEIITNFHVIIHMGRPAALNGRVNIPVLTLKISSQSSSCKVKKAAVVIVASGLSCCRYVHLNRTVIVLSANRYKKLKP